MPDIYIEEVKRPDNSFTEQIKRLEIENLGKEAAINEWIIPVMVRYGKFIVARTDKDKIIGVCQLLKKWDEGDCAFIHSFYIKKGYRNKGYGKRLLGQTLDIVAASGIHSVELTVDPGNDVALGLYRSFGFFRKTTRKDEYGPGRDRHVLRRDL